MELLKKVLHEYRAIHIQTKRLLRFCIAYTTLILLCSVSLMLLAGRGIDYYTAMQIARDCFAAVRPCVGITALGGLLVEGSLHIPKDR